MMRRLLDRLMRRMGYVRLSRGDCWPLYGPECRVNWDAVQWMPEHNSREHCEAMFRRLRGDP